MASYKFPNERIQAAQALLSSVDGLQYHQVDQVVLRDIDGNADPENCQTVVLIPIGGVLGIVTSHVGQTYEDKDIVFVSMQALSNALPALGFKVATHVVGFSLVPPTNPQFNKEEKDV